MKYSKQSTKIHAPVYGNQKDWKIVISTLKLYDTRKLINCNRRTQNLLPN